MTWTRQAIASLMELAGRTAAVERDCQELLAGLAGVADAMTPPEREMVPQHLAICAACREELEALCLANVPPDGARKGH
jgi:hypothetical protein